MRKRLPPLSFLGSVMLAKGQLDEAISCSLRPSSLNRNIPKAERDVEERCALRVSVLSRSRASSDSRGTLPQLRMNDLPQL
jgi:hypothetical protein